MVRWFFSGVLWFSPTFDERSARYKSYILERAVKPKSNHPCFTFEFSHSTDMISYQNSSSQCMNFKRRGLVWKSVAILFSLQCKNHPVLEIQTQKCHESWTQLSRKSYFKFVLKVLSQKHQLEVKIAVWFPWFYQIFRKTSTIVIVVTNYVSNVA